MLLGGSGNYCDKGDGGHKVSLDQDGCIQKNVEFAMDKLTVEMTRKLTDQLEQFLKSCEEEGDTTFTDSL